MVSTRSSVRHHLFPPAAPVAALQEFLSDEEVEAICRQLGHTWRRRLLPPGVTVRSLVYRSLHADRSIAAVVADLAGAGGGPDAAPSGPAWCQARSRLPAALWPELLARSVARLRNSRGALKSSYAKPILTPVARGRTTRATTGHGYNITIRFFFYALRARPAARRVKAASER